MRQLLNRLKRLWKVCSGVFHFHDFSEVVEVGNKFIRFNRSLGDPPEPEPRWEKRSVMQCRGCGRRRLFIENEPCTRADGEMNGENWRSVFINSYTDNDRPWTTDMVEAMFPGGEGYQPGPRDVNRYSGRR
jgi:hypothetical protein